MKPASRLLTGLIAISSTHAAPTGLWQLNGNLAAEGAGQPALDAPTLAPGADYSFGSDAGFQFLQTQPFTTNAKRLTVPNPAGANGGPGATRTNRWSVVMDVKLDAMQPYSGLVQLNPLNNTDVSIYVFSTNNLTGAINAGLSTAGAIAVNTWYRLAITCGNDGAGGGTTMRLYINGVPNGTPRTAVFNGVLSLQSSFHLFSDDTAGGGDLKPAKLGSFGLWSEELSAADIASLGGPQPAGITLPGVPSTIAAASPYLHGANIGWIHAKTPHTGLVIGEYACSGYVHSANCGWINFGDGTPANGIRYENTDGADSGVNHDGAGNLSGLAWGANIGWINFGIDSIGSPRPASDTDRPKLNLIDGQFSGYAYGANVGWINLSTLKTTTLFGNDSDGDGITDAWEIEKFGNLTAANDTSDTDKDGVTDKDENIADSNPNDPNSRLRIVTQQVQFFPDQGYNFWDVTFTSSPRRLYRYETSPDLGATPWYDLTGLFAPSAAATTSLATAVQPAPKNFLRVRAVKPLQP
ncbi:LamG-like jellyroll fold domain-containing protein [Luteolibacter sp. Populi]|uniref:LamG-like jellyroll fold domain-containing protein n=1 Tax=Luteolibacter sp. Populi TaxID=3230487 RepID=UPI0034663A9A